MKKKKETTMTIVEGKWLPVKVFWWAWKRIDSIKLYNKDGDIITIVNTNTRRNRDEKDNL